MYLNVTLPAKRDEVCGELFLDLFLKPDAQMPLAPVSRTTGSA
jgi:hypothetical protein